MMNEVEAIKSLKNIIEYWTYRPGEVEAAKLAISALEKDISKKVIKVTVPKKIGGCVYRCPTCDKLVKFVRCLDCGQKLDWSEV